MAGAGRHCGPWAFRVDAPSGRVYAAYGGVYIAMALVWLWGVDGVRLTPWDVAGAMVSLAGMAVIAFQPK